MNPENTLSEKSQTEKTTYSMLLFIQSFKMSRPEQWFPLEGDSIRGARRELSRLVEIVLYFE